MFGTLPFVPGNPPSRSEPLARFLPPIPDGVISSWLLEHVNKGSWVLDPFGASPRIAIEAARAGYRVLIAANNPIARFLIEITAAPPTKAEFQATLADLAASMKGDERLEPHIQSLYQTSCVKCGHSVIAEAFLWERDAASPYACIYTCQHCGAQGEHPTTHLDAEHAAHYAAGGPHRARALERVASAQDPDRVHVIEAFSVYLPRTVYALFTLINKLDSLSLTPLRRKALLALLLSVADQANALWAYPTSRERPRQLKIPQRFRETNLWLAMERAVDLWTGITESSSEIHPVPFAVWPKLPSPNGGICLFEGRLKDLVDSLGTVVIEAVAAAIPRPNQAYWTLSALWAGWLWGRFAVVPFKGVLRRRRYDWAWHTNALHAALSHLAPHLYTGAPFYGLIGEAEPGFLTAALTAADLAGFKLNHLALRQDQAQIEWQRADPPIEAAGIVRRVARESLSSYLDARAEPSGYGRSSAAISAGIVTHRLAHQIELEIHPPTTDPAAPSISPDEASPALIYTQVQKIIRETLSDPLHFQRYRSGETLEAALYWLRTPQPQRLPLADRIEIELVRNLIHCPGCNLSDFDQKLCITFPGLLAPDPELIQVCLESYAQIDPANQTWKLREQEIPASRRQDLEQAHEMLATISLRLGFTPQQHGSSSEDKNHQVWLSAEGTTQYCFFPIASAVIGNILQDRFIPVGQGIIVLPGGRANLVAYKLQKDPRLADQIAPHGARWRFLKFRHLRWLYDNPLLTSKNLDEQLNLDPLTYTAPQLRLL